MSRSLLLIPILCASLCCVPAPARAEGSKPKTPAVVNIPPPPEEPPIYYGPPPPPPPPPPGYVPLEPIDPSKPQSDPTARDQAPPYFPDDENCRDVGGETLLQLGYDKLGHVESVEIVRSSGNRALDRSARDGAYTWRVNPGLRNGFPVAGQVRVPVHFTPAHKGDSACESALRIQGLRFGRKVVEEGQDRIQYTRSIGLTDTALLQVSYLALKDKPAESISVDWFREDGSDAPIFHTDSPPLPPGADSLEFRLAYKGAWRPGNYSVRVSVSGKYRFSLQFSVAGDGMFPDPAPKNE